MSVFFPSGRIMTIMTDPCFVCKRVASCFDHVLVLSRFITTPPCYPRLVIMSSQFHLSLSVSLYIIPLCLLSFVGSLSIHVKFVNNLSRALIRPVELLFVSVVCLLVFRLSLHSPCHSFVLPPWALFSLFVYTFCDCILVCAWVHPPPIT